MLVHFAGQTKIQLTRHFYYARETASANDIATAPLPQPHAYHHIVHKPCKVHGNQKVCATVDYSSKNMQKYFK
jgi:thiaminase